ncbi:MAG: MtaA/CmuA family methyltransferase, partial [Deltaproteobacteria bacterium]|nr:MtaA/CmuA family methyltransferase [Deltaproteobacteria bacterium]
PKERLFATLDRQPVDRIPVAQPLQTGTVELMKSCNAYWPQAHSDPELMAALAYEAYKVIGFESVRVPFDINMESEAMGCVLNFAAGSNKGLDIQPPVKTPPMTGPDDFENVIDPDPYKDGRMPVILKAIKILKKMVPDTIPIFSLVVGPFMVAGQVRGVDAFMRELMRKPECCVNVIERAHKACLNFALAQAEAGSDCIVIADATASPDLISPLQFEKYAKPYTKDICDKIPIRSILHICGKAHSILAHMSEVTSGISIDSSVDIAEAKGKVGENTAVCGNVDVNTVLLFGDPPDVEAAVKTCIDKRVDLLTTSCGIPSVVPTANLKAMVEAGKKYGAKT